MAVGGFSSYGQILAAQPEHPFGNFRKGMDGMQGIFYGFKKQKLRGELAGIYKNNQGLDPAVASEAAAFSEAGDFDGARDVLARAMRAKEYDLNRGIREDALDERRKNNAFNQQIRMDALNEKRAAADKAKQDADNLISYRLANLDRAADLIDQSPMSFSDAGWVARRFTSEGRGNRSEVKQRLAGEVQDIMAELKSGGVAAQLMNSDAEGRRALGVLENADNYTGTELKSAMSVLKERMMRARGGAMPGQDRQLQSDGPSMDDMDRIAMGQ